MRRLMRLRLRFGREVRRGLGRRPACIVPATLRLGYGDRFLGLLFRYEGFDSLLGGGERIGVKVAGDLVAFLRAFAIAACGRQRKPFVGLREALVGSQAARRQYSEIVLAVGDAVLGRFPEPLHGSAVVWLALDALGIEHG